LEGFSPTPDMPEIEESAAMLAALGESEEVKAEITQLRRLSRLNVAYGNALFAARGFGAPETTAAFVRARGSDHGYGDERERLAADYGVWAGSYVRGELPSMRAHADAFLNDVRARPNSPEAGIALRISGVTHQFAGEYAEARDNLERALVLFQPGRDDDLAFLFGLDAGVAVLICSAIALWPLGEVYRATSLAESADARIAALKHIGTLAFGRHHSALFELMRGNRVRAAESAFELARVARDHDLTMFRPFAVFLQGWAAEESGRPGVGLEDMRRGVDLLREQNVLLFDGLLKIGLAEAEARAGDPERAVAIVDETLAACERTGYRAFEAELHRARGQVLLRRDPADFATAEQALQTAVAVARQQGTRSFELRAALSLAKLYQSTGRLVEAHLILAPALEGFSPTPEMPEIAEAHELLAALVETTEVKAEVERRQLRQHLQVSYGNALIAARGFGAAETTEAFARARDAALGEKDAPERLAADFGLWAGSYTRGELMSMRAHAAAFLADVAGKPDLGEAGIACRCQGITSWFAGEYLEARDHLERALASFQPGRDDELAYRFGMDPGVPAMAYLALVLWSIGEIDNAPPLVERMRERIGSLSHANTLALGTVHACAFELMRGNRSRLQTDANELVGIVREHDLRLFRAFGEYFEGWAAADGGALTEGLEGMRRGATSLREQNALVFDGLINIALSEAEARACNLERAIAALDEALATVERAGFRAFEAELHRARGEMLLRREPANFADAEQAFQTAIAVARQQTTRSFELRAAMSLAKLYRSTGRFIEAHAVLAPSLENFFPTKEMPEIDEAQALLGALAESEQVKTAEAQRQRRLRLQTTYGQAMMWSKGYAAKETKAAFARAAELAAKSDGFSERFTAREAQFWIAATEGELRSARELALIILREAEAAGRVWEARAANSMFGLVAYWRGDFAEARTCCERALDVGDASPDPNDLERFGDGRAYASSFLAMIMWQLGEVERARELINWATIRANELGHIGVTGADFRADGQVYGVAIRFARGGI
jgi:predicted ATPase